MEIFVVAEVVDCRGRRRLKVVELLNHVALFASPIPKAICLPSTILQPRNPTDFLSLDRIVHPACLKWLRPHSPRLVLDRNLSKYGI